jgi:hypothetical protein
MTLIDASVVLLLEGMQAWTLYGILKKFTGRLDKELSL